MSLIDEANSQLTPYKLMISEKAGKEVERKFIIQPNVLTNILEDEMSSRSIDKKSKKDFKGFRTKIHKTSWTLKHMLNFVDESLYRGQIEKTIESMLKHIRLRQPNGDSSTLRWMSVVPTKSSSRQSRLRPQHPLAVTPK